MRLGGWDWAHTNLGCPSVLVGFGVGPCVAGPFELWNGMRGVVETLCRFWCYLKV
jgi:hypothetical protein